MNKENQIIVARKYAQAFINLFSNTLTKDQFEKMENFLAYLKKHEKSLFYADLKILDLQKRKNLFRNLIEKFELNTKFKNLTDLLIAHQRAFMLSDIIECIIRLYQEKSNTILFKILSSHQLSSSQKDIIVKFLERKLHKEVLAKLELDKNLIAGIKAISDNFEWEDSVQQKLNLLSQT